MARNISTSLASWLISPSSVGESPWHTHYPKSITSEFDQFFDTFWQQRGEKSIVSDGANLPRTNVYEDSDGLVLEALIPFADRDDINITLDPVVNSVKIEVSAHQDDTEGREYHLREISRTSFKRTFIVDKRFKVADATGNYEGSVLTLSIPSDKESGKKTLKIK